MAISRMLPKDALVLCTVTVLFIYFGIVLWTNFTIILPYWTPLFWAAALSVPLHALKSRLLPVLHEALQGDFLDIFASVIGAVVYFILQFFLGSYIANALKALFLGYCHVIHLISDGQSRNPTTANEKQSPTQKDGDTEYEGTLDRRSVVNDDDDILDGEDYELHPSYQQFVDQEHDKYARPPNWPSYMNLLRFGFLYIVFQFTTHSELIQFFKDDDDHHHLWKNQIVAWKGPTSSQITWFILAILIHIVISTLGRVIFLIERLFYPGLTPQEQAEISLLRLIPRVLKRALQESLHSLVSLVLVLSTLFLLGLLGTILSMGVVHDVQGLVTQMHQRVMFLRQEQLFLHGIDVGTTGYLPQGPKHPLVQQADDALTSAYDAGINWIDPILKESFPDLAWGTVDWVQNLANVVVDVVVSPAAAAAAAAAVAEAQEEEKEGGGEDEEGQGEVTTTTTTKATGPPPPPPPPPSSSVVAIAETASGMKGVSTCKPIVVAEERDLKDHVTDKKAEKDDDDDVSSQEHVETNNILKEKVVEEEDQQEPELWVIPTLDSIIEVYKRQRQTVFGFRDPKKKEQEEEMMAAAAEEKEEQQEQEEKAPPPPKQRIAINISQARRLMKILLAHEGLDTSNMLWGFNTFNDLFFRWILFLLGLITLTGLKVSPLQRIGWIIDQALVSSSSLRHEGASRLSTSSSSPGRVLAKSLEFAITGTFVSMLKLSIYHTIFTLVWTRFLFNRATAALMTTVLNTTGDASVVAAMRSSSFVPV
ncbi:hypothetical protein BGZ65_004571, partial [Modicella reniformis]